MTAVTILQGPTLANPDALTTVDELRRELHRANERLLADFIRRQQENNVGNELAGMLNRLLLRHLASDSNGVAEVLASFLEERPRLREKLEEVNEVAAMQRTTH